MSGLQGLLSSPALPERASRGQRLHNFPEVGVEERGSNPGPWARARQHRPQAAGRPVHPLGNQSESTTGLGLASLFLVSKTGFHSKSSLAAL